MRELLLAIGVASPVLLLGPSVGKTSYVRRAAELMGQHEAVFLFCDEQWATRSFEWLTAA